eukprot:Protomagalhaensia_sp_Gyna_25__597@NODE_1282_length_1983_cov_15_293724_g1023_i0_p1_GENE_NODE_1282_length_1983_cov_15_293724_g1023_i0NODE_1282_length_1983_cov_15_293724_g1023_i0_p1_ORF_typecomplete_len365_score77_16ISN1/PF06437_11/2e72_NODE_1282_length_1983_cov_15_293724_g1023_i03041398
MSTESLSRCDTTEAGHGPRDRQALHFGVSKRARVSRRPRVTYAAPSSSIPFALNDPLFTWVADAVTGLQAVNCGPLDIYNVLVSVEKCIAEHRVKPESSFLSRTLGPLHFWTDLPLRNAFKRMDMKYRITKRRHIPISVHEIRQTFNLAQVLASAKDLRLVTFDGDETLYDHGASFEDKEMARLLLDLLRRGCYVAVVTAAAYGFEREPYEARLQGFLSALKESDLTPEQYSRFLLFGGQSNYLFKMAQDYHLKAVPYSEWEMHSPIGFTKERDLESATQLLDVAEQALQQTITDLGLRTRLIRKQRAVGVIPGGLKGLELCPIGSGAKTLKPEILEEAVARVREAVDQSGKQIRHPPVIALFL